MSLLQRIFWLVIGFVMLGLAFAGAVLPLLPATPFLLVAAFAFARSSKRLHDWLMSHRYFGKLIRDWRETGSIGRGTKVGSALVMIATIALSWQLGVPLHILAIQVVVLSASAIFVLSRPAPPEEVARRSKR